ncbi:hypothetical protein CDN99_19115 [Roseateles aquatilis]|uniref:Plasmid stabilization protein n=1 Tax=Roseateles aquatilis TaxID=431061 RepID=A0A246J2L5_9BURK|nr:type II toxin-antitoxin system RelE/ParE family toxin [Roseateles aquatilis]OWQ86829.1 hypothetical protein CDN99_19115 [Roseateles aquatilis]
MNAKALRYNTRAKNDVREVLDYYIETTGELALVRKLLGEMSKAFRHIAMAPGTGSPRHQEGLGAPGVRFWKLTRFPHLIFYVELAQSIRVLRIMHGKQDISRRFHTP